MDSNLINATNLILKGIDNGWNTPKIQREVYKVAPVFKGGEHPKYMYGILIYEEQVVLIRVEERHTDNLIEVVFNIGE